MPGALISASYTVSRRSSAIPIRAIEPRNRLYVRAHASFRGFNDQEADRFAAENTVRPLAIQLKILTERLH